MKTGTKTAEYMMYDYGRQSTFSSFLPGIGGIEGIPIWCFYVNRGQCVVSFGVENKDHSIMEFLPAHQAYQNVKRTGFRTFLKVDGVYYEPFQQEEHHNLMKISMNGLEIEEDNTAVGIHTKVVYYTLPGEKVGALVRKVTLKNTGLWQKDLEVLDGMPACIPYGVDMDSIKTMGQTIKAWMQVEDVQEKLPYFRVRVSTTDSSSVTEVAGGNFSFACLADGTRLLPIVDPEAVFSYDTTLNQGIGFINLGVEGLLKKKQVTQNQFPCNFYGTVQTLKPQEELVIYQVIGQVESKEILQQFMSGVKNEGYFEAKKIEADSLAEELCKGIDTRTGSKDFDAYCKYTYLDNVLRGGYPIKIGDKKIFYVYSRKHGDLERDYNYYSTLPEFYSQGNGNFRDVNQNRRCDIFFAPFIGNENILQFYNLIQLDGYNPLVIEKVTYALEQQDAGKVLGMLDEAVQRELTGYLETPFTPGMLCNKLEELELYKSTKYPDLFEKIMNCAISQVNANFGEGYWCDHWTYNLDLIESYLEVFPEKEKELLLAEEFTYFVSQKNINKRFRRYAKTKYGIRQYYALDDNVQIKVKDKLIRGNYGAGKIVTSNLLEKLILISTIKFATLDAYGMGIEMEGGKPGWYDALNGLPGIFGSSMTEAYELERNLEYTLRSVQTYGDELDLIEELSELMEELAVAVKQEKDALFSEMEVISFWNKINDAKEAYRDKIYRGISGVKVRRSKEEVAAILRDWLSVVQQGIKKACALETGISPTYFSFEVTEYEETGEGILPKHFKVVNMPHFLEGPVRYLKISKTMEDKKTLYHNIRKSDLYDKKLSMYKVNDSLRDASFEIGRARAFTPGWLENESIWLHMEYKYLLELLKSEMYPEFFEDFHLAAIPFLDPKIYGRSIYENSSFIASSNNPNESYHGKGFVARLSGSTIEFIQMWKIMMFGKAPFTLEEGELILRFQPAIPEYLINDQDQISAAFLSKTTVTYHLNGKKQLIPGQYQISSIECEDRDGKTEIIADRRITGDLAHKIREGSIHKINIRIS